MNLPGNKDKTVGLDGLGLWNEVVRCVLRGMAGYGVYILGNGDERKGLQEEKPRGCESVKNGMSVMGSQGYDLKHTGLGMLLIAAGVLVVVVVVMVLVGEVVE